MSFEIKKTTPTPGGGGGPVTGLTGTATQIVYIDNSGNGTGDALFTRDSVTGETFIGLTGTDLASNLQITPTGNTLTWDADTTDDIVDQIIQSADVLGSGSPGSVLTRYDTSTSERAIIGTSEFAGVITVFGSATNPDDSITSNMTISANASGGFGFTYEDTNTNQRSRFRMNTDDGNLWQFTPDISGNIDTTVEQNNDILGLGILSGSALTWSDTSTQIHAIIGAVDATAAGLYPGSTLIATNNFATGASASIATNYDNVLNAATVIANAGNGDFDSGFEFDDGRMVVRYRNTTSGFESSFESDINGAITRYKLNTATDEYSTQVSNGVFQFFNSTTADQYLSLGASTGIYQFGDISGALNDTKFIVNDSAQIITAHVDGVFSVEDGAASSIAYIDAANRQSVFGNVSASSGIKLFIDDAAGINVQAPGGVVNIGGNTYGDDTTIKVDDPNKDISFLTDGLTTHSYDIPITVKYTLSSSQLLAIGTTPIEVVPAPGAGKMVQVINVSSKYNFNSTNYATAGANFVTRYTNDAAGAGGSGQFSGGTNLVTATGQSNPYGLWTPIGGIGGIIFSTTFENQGISIQTDDNSDPTAGNGTLDVYVTYKIVIL